MPQLVEKCLKEVEKKEEPSSTVTQRHNKNQRLLDCLKQAVFTLEARGAAGSSEDDAEVVSGALSEAVSKVGSRLAPNNRK